MLTFKLDAEGVDKIKLRDNPINIFFNLNSHFENFLGNKRPWSSHVNFGA